jgi:IstB-like ATP binding protein
MSLPPRGVRRDAVLTGCCAKRPSDRARSNDRRPFPPLTFVIVPSLVSWPVRFPAEQLARRTVMKVSCGTEPQLFIVVPRMAGIRTSRPLPCIPASLRYEHGSTIVTSNLPFDEWTSVFGSERLIGALLDRLTHHLHILEMNGDSYRLNNSKQHPRRASLDTPADNPTQA